MEEDQKSKIHKCKFCSKIFPCGRSLGGHMRSHLINISSTEKKLPPLPAAVSRRLDDDGSQRENPKKASKFSGKSGDQRSHDDDHSMMCKEDNTNSVSSHSNYSSSSSSDNEETPLLFCNNKMKKKKRSNTSKRYTKKNNATTDYSNCVSEQEEVAFSLILLSMDYTNSALQSTNQAEEAEVNSPKTNFIKKKGPFKSDHSKKRKQQQQQQLDSELINDSCKFKCIICKKAFPSYQALGGHRASHKKFKGCCAPTTQTHHSPNILAADFEECKKIKEHECPICLKIFPSGQALGGHKRSHLIGDEAKSSDHASVSTIERRRIPQVRDFLDLNLPAPDLDEDCTNEFNPYSCLQFLAY